MSILPNILDVARQYNLNIYPSTSTKAERFCDCPFCGGKKTFRLNTEKNVYICNRYNNCGVRGGVLDLLIKLTGKSRDELINSFKTKEGVRAYGRIKNMHPVMSIPREELRKMKLNINNPDWFERTMIDWSDRLKKYPKTTKDELDFIWYMYKSYQKRQIKNLYSLLDQINALKIKEEIINTMAECQEGVHV